MESKEATSYPVSVASPGSFTSYTIPYSDSIENASLLNKPVDLSENNDDNSRTDSTKGTVSEDEGYISGYEEFESELNKPVLDGENSDDSSKIESWTISEATVSGDGGVGKGSEYTEGDEEEDLDDGSGFDDRDEGKSEIVPSIEKLGVNSDEGAIEGGEIVCGKEGDEKVEEVEMKGEEKIKSLSVGGDEVSEAEVKSMGEEDSVVDTIRVDVAGPGVAIVGGPEEDGDVVNEPVEEVVDEVAEVEPEKVEVVSGGDVELTSEGDSVVDTIQVDVVGPGVAVVGEAEENGDVVSEAVEEVVAEVAVDEPEKLEVVCDGEVKLTSEGDSVVDAVQVDVVGPGVAVVGEAEENGGEKIESIDSVENTVDVVETNPFQPVHDVVGDEKDENLGIGAQTCVASNDFVEKSEYPDMEVGVKKPEVETEATENGIIAEIHTDGEVDELTAGVLEKSKPVLGFKEIREVEDEINEINPEDSDEETDGMISGTEAAKKFIEELERESGSDSQTRVLEQSHDIDGQIVMDSEEEEEGEETDVDDEGDVKELFDSAALAALLKAATGSDSNGTIRISSEDLPKLFSVERPAGLGSSLQSLRPAARSNLNRPSLFTTLTPAGGGGGESEESLSEEEKKKLEKLQQIRVKFLRIVHRLGLSPEESVAAQVLYRLALLGGKQNTQSFSLDAAKRAAMELEAEEKDDLDFTVNILVLGKSGVGKSATINSVFGEAKAPIEAFGTGTVSVNEISGVVNGVKVRVVDTPGLKSSVVGQCVNRRILSSVKKFTKKNPPDVVLYVDRLDAQTRDLNDLPLLKTVTSVLGSSIWRSAIVTLTHSASAPPDGPSGTPLSYEVFVSQRSHVVQQSIGHSVGDLRMMSPSLMNPVSLVENHPSCRKNREGHKILPNGQSWRPQLLLLCYSMKILAEASSISKPQDPFDHRKLFGFRARAPPLPYMLSSMLQSRVHPKLPSDQGLGENGDSDIDMDDFPDFDEEEDEYDRLPPFKSLSKYRIAKLSKEHRKAYFEEYDYRVKLLQKKQWREELRRMRELKKRGNNNNNITHYDLGDDESDSGAPAPVSVPLPDMTLPPSFDGDNPAYRYRFLEPTSQFLARPVLDTHGWDHDCGYDGVNLEHSFAILNRFPAVYTFQITKDKKDFTVSLDSSIAAKHGENISTMAGFDVQNIGKQLAYIFRGEAKIKNLKRNKATGGISFTVLGENVIPALKIEDQITFGKQYSLVGSVGAVRSQKETAYGANFELQKRENDYPIGQVQSTFSMSVIKWRGDLALGLNGLFQLALWRNSKMSVRAGINNKMSGQVTVRTTSSENLNLALAAVIPVALSVYRKLIPELAAVIPVAHSAYKKLTPVLAETTPYIRFLYGYLCRFLKSVADALK